MLVSTRLYRKFLARQLSSVCIKTIGDLFDQEVSVPCCLCFGTCTSSWYTCIGGLPFVGLTPPPRACTTQFEALKVYYIMCGNYHSALASMQRLTDTSDNFAYFVQAAEEVVCERGFCSPLQWMCSACASATPAGLALIENPSQNEYLCSTYCTVQCVVRTLLCSLVT